MNTKRRVVCLIPSLTETLIEAGVNVIARTRYCVHPEEVTKTLPVVGGTKDLDLDKLNRLQPDLLILDREENLAWMRDKAPCEVVVTHIDSLESMATTSRELEVLLPVFKNWTARFEKVCEAPNAVWNWNKIPAAQKQWGTSAQELIYVVWKNPWMAVGPGTYIYSVLSKLGASEFLVPFDTKYPKLAEEELKKSGRCVLFSSEPYAFGKKDDELENWSRQGALVDGECYSWFGIRSLRFLERALKLQS